MRSAHSRAPWVSNPESAPGNSRRDSGATGEALLAPDVRPIQACIVIGAGLEGSKGSVSAQLEVCESHWRDSAPIMRAKRQLL